MSRGFAVTDVDRKARRRTMKDMTMLTSLLKTEFSCLARKRARAETASLMKSVGMCRAEITALKRRAHPIELELRRLSKAHAQAVSPALAVN